MLIENLFLLRFHNSLQQLFQEKLHKLTRQKLIDNLRKRDKYFEQFLHLLVQDYSCIWYFRSFFIFPRKLIHTNWCNSYNSRSDIQVIHSIMHVMSSFYHDINIHEAERNNYHPRLHIFQSDKPYYLYL